MNLRREIWTEHHGLIPKGWLVFTLNGQPSDCRPENLAAIPRKTNDLKLIVSPFMTRIRILERELNALKKLMEEKER